jgi:transposase
LGTPTKAGIVTTNEFKNFTCPKKFACYAGVAPFEHTSGTSIKGRPRLSRKANMSMKALLHMAALVSMQYNEELRNFYERRVAEGKSKMSVLNMIRNKLIHRVFACVRDNRKYENSYINSLA